MKYNTNKLQSIDLADLNHSVLPCGDSEAVVIHPALIWAAVIVQAVLH